MKNQKAILGAIFSIFTLYSHASGQLVFPHFAQGGGYQTTFTLTNLSATAAAATVQVFLDNGTSLTNLILLASNGTGKATLTGTALTTGWAQITLSPAVNVSGLETIQLLNAGSVIAETSVLPAAPNTAFRFPATERDGIATGLAMANPAAMTGTVSLLLRDQGGATVATQAFSLGPSQHVARFIAQFFHGIGPFEGSVEVSSSQAIAIIALKQLSSGIFSTLPSAPPSAISSESFFSPGGGIAARIVQEIQRAGASIDIAIYTFTETEIADALVVAKNRGVAIRIIADSEEAIGAASVVPRLQNAGFQLKRTAGIGTGIMHNKYAIFDGRALVTGSYN
jgi:hypothetical protein